MANLLQHLQSLSPASLWTLAPKPVLMQAVGLLATGDIIDLRWSGDDVLEVEFPNRLGTTLHRLRLNGERLEGLCDAHGSQACAHHLASLMLALHLLKDASAFGRFPNRVLAERLKGVLLRLDESAIQDAAQTRTASRHVLIQPRGERLFVFRDTVRGQPRDVFASVPAELRSFASMWSTTPDKEAAFWRWFVDPLRRFPVFIELGDRVLTVETPHATGWSGHLVLACDGQLVTLRRTVHHYDQPVAGDQIAVGSSLIYLAESKQLVRLPPSSAWSTATALQNALDRGSLRSRAQSLEDGITIDRWNAAGIRFTGQTDAPAGSLPRLEWKGHSVEDAAPMPVRQVISLTPSAQGSRLAVNIHSRAGDVAVPASSSVLAFEREFELLRWGADLLASKSRERAILDAFLRCILERDNPAACQSILSELSKQDCFRSQSQADEAVTTLCGMLSIEPPFAKTASRRPQFSAPHSTHQNTDTSDGRPAGGASISAEGDLICASPEHGWIRLAPFEAQEDAACAVARHVLGAVPDNTNRADLIVPLEDALPRLPAVLAACTERGISLTYADHPIHAASLLCSVTAERRDSLDFFELRPEVTCSGDLIPQEQWEALVLKGTYVDADGVLRVIDVKSLRSLQRLSGILERQRSEARDGAQKQDVKPNLRIPRVRMLDWLMLQKEGIRCDLPDADRAVLESLLRFESLERLPLPASIRATLRDYQHSGYSWLGFLYKHGFGGCLADDMGLGKTLQTITLLAAIKEGIVAPLAADQRERRPHLLVVPPTLIFNWQNEVRTFCPGLYVHEYTGRDRSLAGIGEGIVLTTYELVRRDIEKLRDARFDCIIFDEAQAVKNMLGERAKAMRQLNGRFKLTLTGTPLENHIGEYFSIIDLSLPGLLGDWQTFSQDIKSPAPEFDPVARANPFVLRRTKERILTELPPKVETDLHLDLSEEQKRFYTRAVADVRAEVLAAFKDKTAQQAGIVALAALTRLRQICISPALIDPSHASISPKLSHLVEKLGELESEGHSALVFSQFTKSLDLLEKLLTAAGLPFQRLDGSTPQQQRKKLVESFQTRRGPGIFLISLRAGGAGLNLTRASYVFHLDPWWNPAVENQASDRAHRMGQQQTVFIQRLIMRHTIEEKIMLMKQQKRDVFERVLGGAEAGRAASGQIITREDIAFLLG